jgi:hypothetical protein
MLQQGRGGKKMSKSKRLIREIIAVVAISIVLSYSVLGQYKDPVGPESIAIIDSQRMDSWGGYPIAAEAGNVTELFINATGLTEHWAGFYGNITGYITLDDGDNWTMYDWRVAEPQGKIYATTLSPPTWGNIDCLNHSSTYSVVNLEDDLDMEQADNDGVNDTFCPGCSVGQKDGAPANHSEFFVGYKQFNARDCWAIATYVNDADQYALADPDFIEVLLQDGTAAVYMTIIEDKDTDAEGDVLGFDNRNHDFQMMVGENGNGSAALTTTDYYFYVELE